MATATLSSNPTAAVSSSPSVQIIDIARLDPATCTCGQSRRAVGNDEQFLASIHVLEVAPDAKPHYHPHMGPVELYYSLNGDTNAYMELDGNQVPFPAGTSILIGQYCKHRAVGKNLREAILVLPKHGSPGFEMLFDEPPAPVPGKRRFQVIPPGGWGNLSYEVNFDPVPAFAVHRRSLDNTDHLRTRCPTEWLILAAAPDSYLKFPNQPPQPLRPELAFFVPADTTYNVRGRVEILQLEILPPATT